MSKDLAEAQHDLLASSALVAADPKSEAARAKCAEIATRATQSISELMSVLSAEVELLGTLDAAIAAIRNSLPKLDQPPQVRIFFFFKKKKQIKSNPKTIHKATFTHSNLSH